MGVGTTDSVNPELAQYIDAFGAKISAIKQNLNGLDFEWYPYGSLGNFLHLDDMIPGGWISFQNRLKGTRIVDIGAADGDTSFFLEERGVSVDIIDNPPTNFNHLKGAYRLKRELASNVSIYEIDIDQQFSLPNKYDFVLLLGTLYHLKNPYYVLELLAKNAKSVALSTRVCSFDKVGGTFIRTIPAAYLVDSYEANNDPTNYWMFTHEGLKRILHRSGWNIRAFKTYGSVKQSDPYSSEYDERAFVYAESTYR